jgi:uncharacterized protein (TIRG00374 family)
LKRILQLTAVVALTVFFLWLFLRNSNLAAVGGILKTTSVPWLLVGFVVNFGALLFRTARWRTILDPQNPPPFYATFFANSVGYMLSTILPIRAADVARPALLARKTTHKFSGALGTVVTERILDLAAILLMFVIFAAIRWNDFSHLRWFVIVKTGAIVCGLLLVLLTGFLIGIYFSSGTIRRAHAVLGRLLPKRWREGWMNFFDSFTDSVELAHDRVTLVKVLALTVGVWACLTGQFYFATLALHRRLPFDASFFITGTTTLGLAIPTPGGVGGFHKVCQFVLTNFYGFDIDASVAVAVIFHIIGTIPVIIAGVTMFAREGLSLKQLQGEHSDSPRS